GPSIEVPPENYKGTHRPEGFFTLYGRDVRAGKTATASIADLAPTLLAAAGLNVPSDMTGRVLDEFFNVPLNCRQGPPATLALASGSDVYTESEKATVEQRLADLGYVD